MAAAAPTAAIAAAPRNGLVMRVVRHTHIRATGTPDQGQTLSALCIACTEAADVDEPVHQPTVNDVMGGADGRLWSWGAHRAGPAGA